MTNHAQSFRSLHKETEELILLARACITLPVTCQDAGMDDGEESKEAQVHLVIMSDLEVAVGHHPLNGQPREQTLMQATAHCLECVSSTLKSRGSGRVH